MTLFSTPGQRCLLSESGESPATKAISARLSLTLGSCWFQQRMDAQSPETYDMVANALKYGYRHIDTAWGYGNEEAVGKAVRDSGIPREQIFVTTKLTWVLDICQVQED